MTQVLHIITPVTRPETLPEIFDSIVSQFDRNDESLRVVWWCVFDSMEDVFQTGCEHLKASRGGIDWPGMWRLERHYSAFRVKGYGGPQRNFAIDQIVDGWVTFIDDDSCLHPDYIKTIRPFLAQGPKAYLYGQEFKNGGRKWFDMDDPCRHFEHSMLTIHRSLIGDVRQTASYDCDKQFVRPIYKAHANEFVIIPQTLAYYNWIRDDGWSWKK